MAEKVELTACCPNCGKLYAVYNVYVTDSKHLQVSCQNPKCNARFRIDIVNANIKVHK